MMNNENIIDFNETKINDVYIESIKRVFCTCEYDDFQILYIRKNQYFSANFIAKQLNESKIQQAHKFLELQRTQDYIEELSKEIQEFTPFKQIGQDGLSNEQKYISGYYFHQRLLQQFICWCDIKKTILYDKILMKQLQTKKATTLLEEQIQELNSKNQKQKNKLNNLNYKINRENVWKIFIIPKDDIFQIITRKDRYLRLKPDLENIPNANVIVDKFRTEFRENVRRNDVSNMEKQQILAELQKMIEKETKV